MKKLFVVGLVALAWVYFGSDNSVANEEPQYEVASYEYIDNQDSYIGDVISVNGIIESTRFTDKGIAVVIGGIHCYFNGNDSVRFSEKYSVGDTATIKGRGVERYTDTPSELYDCTVM